MDRQEFLKICGVSCLGIIGLSGIVQSCSPTHYANSSIKNNQLTISLKEFEQIEKGIIKYRKYVITKVEGIDYPIVIYKNINATYTAILLRCSHQGAELTVNGDILTCPAHGSEFDKNGIVTQGPAEQQLTAFKTQSDTHNIYIQLS